MQEPQTDVIGFFFQQGILGVLVVCAILVIRYLYTKVESLYCEIRDLLEKHVTDIRSIQDEKIAMQEGYIQEQREVRKEIAEVANQANLALKTFSDVLNEVKQDIRGR